MTPYDVYYYNEGARTVWLYNKRAAGRVTAVSPSASAPASVTVAGVTYAIASPSVAYQLSSLSGGGVGQVVTLLLGMNDAAVSVLTGDAADAVFYGVVQSSSRTLVETNSAEVQQAVSVMCTDGTARTVNVDNKLNFPAGKLVEISVDGDGESVQSISPRSTSGTVSADGTALGDTPFADNVQIIDTTSEGEMCIRDRILEDHGHAVSPDVIQLLFRHLQKILTIKQDRAVNDSSAPRP